MIGGRFAGELQNMPTPSYKIDEIVNSLLERKNTIFMIQEHGVADYVFEAVVKRCKKFGMQSIMTCHADDVEGSPRLHFLRRAGLQPTSRADRINVDKIMESPDCPELIILRNIDNLNAENLKIWTLFIYEWARALCINKNPFCRRLLLMDLRSTSLLGDIVHEPGWDVHWMWKWISPLENQAALKSMLLESTTDDDDGIWLEALLPDIAGPDLELLEWLFYKKSEITNYDSIYSYLLSYAEEKNLSNSNIIRLYMQRKTAGIYLSKNVPENLWPFWEAGIIDYTKDEGVFFNSAFLAVAGENVILKHRIWKGISRLLLPAIDYTRVNICNWLNMKYENQWLNFCKQEAMNDERMYRMEAGNVQEQNNHITEFRGILNFMIDKGMNKNPAFSRYFNSLKCLRDSRNVLAHCKLLDKDKFIQTLQECARLKEIIES